MSAALELRGAGKSGRGRPTTSWSAKMAGRDSVGARDRADPSLTSSAVLAVHLSLKERRRAVRPACSLATGCALLSREKKSLVTPSCALFFGDKKPR
ncbi:hypothetical protein MTO96_014435 [Rhipicephalus appendiculatus]